MLQPNFDTDSGSEDELDMHLAHGSVPAVGSSRDLPFAQRPKSGGQYSRSSPASSSLREIVSSDEDGGTPRESDTYAGDDGAEVGMSPPGFSNSESDDEENESMGGLFDPGSPRGRRNQGAEDELFASTGDWHFDDEVYTLLSYMAKTQ